MVAIVGLAYAGSGCAVLGLGEEGREGGTATLSGAALAASDSSRKHRPLDVGDTTPGSGAEVSVGGGSGESLALSEELTIGRPYERSHPIWGLVAEVGAFGGHDYDGYGGGGLSIGGYASDRLRLDLIGTAGSVDFTGQSLLGHAFKNALDMKLEVLARYDLTSSRTFMSLAPLAAIGTGTLFWDYAAPVAITVDGVLRMVSDDRINHFYAYTGLGVSLVRTRHFLLDGRIEGGVRLYGWHTANGLRNDLLATTGFGQFQVGMGFR